MLNLPFVKYVRPGWIDEARLIIQGAVFKEFTREERSRGACLNAGCGDGLYLDFLESFKNFSRIVHLDPQPPGALNSKDARHTLTKGSLTALPFEDGAFDFCLCSEVLEHIEDHERALSELERVLKPGGNILISVPTPPAPEDPAHVREGYTLERLSELLENHGFRVERHAYCFHGIMRILFRIWQWQYRVLGKSKRSYMPRFLVNALAHADKAMKFGRPWDLVVLARRREHAR